MTKPHQGRLIIVSNRLPVTLLEDEGPICFETSSGGLATGLASHLNQADLWVGWPGRASKALRSPIAELLREQNLEPVFLSDQMVDRYYDGFANRTLWPVLHSYQNVAVPRENEWADYIAATTHFLQVLDPIVKPGDQIWIHDYQLMMLPGMLRARHPNASIGFFLHTPFPRFDVFRALPQGREILGSLLGCDLIGFHTKDDSRSFLDNVHELLQIESVRGRIGVGGRTLQTTVHPMGVDFESFSKAIDTEIVDPQIRDAKLKSVLSVSRLDNPKDIAQTLKSFELLLERERALHQSVELALVVVPSREKVDGGARLKKEIDETVERINAKYGDPGWTPIRLIDRKVRFDELIRLYRTSHVAFIAPVRDGMNLVAKEYVAARNDGGGVLILSQTAGAAKELADAIIVNPVSVEGMCDALVRALRMPEREQEERMHRLRNVVATRPVQTWGREFVEQLLKASQQRDLQRQPWCASTLSR